MTSGNNNIFTIEDCYANTHNSHADANWFNNTLNITDEHESEMLFGFTMEITRNMKADDFFGLCYRIMGNVVPGDVIRCCPATSHWSGLQYYVPKDGRTNKELPAVKEMIFRDRYERNETQRQAVYRYSWLRKLGQQAAKFIGQAKDAEEVSDGKIGSKINILGKGFKCDVYLRSCNCRYGYGWKVTKGKDNTFNYNRNDLENTVYELTRDIGGGAFAKITKINDFVK